MPAFVHILTSVMFPRRVLVRRKSVSGDDSSLGLLGLEPATRSTVSLCDSVSISESDEVACWCTLLSGGCRGCWRPIELYSNLPMCALIIAAFSVFFPLKVILWWEKYKDSSSTLKDDSLSELYSPTQSGYFVLLEVVEGQMLFCLGIYEGSCINPIWEVGGPRLFWPKVS